MLTDGSAAPIWRAEHLPFGGLFSNTVATVENNLRFPGQYLDAETGLHQNWFRDYDPLSGRYREADPLGVKAAVNLYDYVGGDPIGGIDARGLYRRGDVVYRTDPAKPSDGDVAMIWDDPTADQDGNGDEWILAFGDPTRCPDECTGKAALVRLNGLGDPYEGWTIAGSWKPGWWSRGSDATYQRRWEEWQRVNPSWTPRGVHPSRQCFTLVNAMTGTWPSFYLGGLRFGPRDLEYWRRMTGAP
jgi:RHS repeat-associated protein